MELRICPRHKEYNTRGTLDAESLQMRPWLPDKELSSRRQLHRISLRAKVVIVECRFNSFLRLQYVYRMCVHSSSHSTQRVML